MWFEWYADQSQLTPEYGRHIQEVDYSLYYTYTAEPIATTFETGWLAYTLPPIGGDAHTTYELYVKLSFDDSKLFGTEEPILNPYVYYGIDVDLGRYGSWIELGVSHDFELADCGCGDVPILKHTTVTPSVVLGIDHRFLDKVAVEGEGTEGPATRLANIVYGLEANVDMSAVLGIPEQFGSVSLGTFLNYSQAFRDDLLDDELWGGVKLGWSW